MLRSIYTVNINMDNNFIEEYSKRKIIELETHWVVGKYNRHTGNEVRSKPKEFYKPPWLFMKIYYENFPILTDDYKWKFITLVATALDFETNRLDEFELDNMFEWKTRQAKYKFVKELIDKNLIKKIDWYYYFNPHFVNEWWQVKIWSKQDKIYKLFE